MYEGYGAACRKNNLVPVGCIAHVRRKFDEALKAQSSVDPNQQKSTLAATAIKKLQNLYRIEREKKQLSDDERQQVRQPSSVPVLKELRHWLDEHLFLMPLKSALGKAMYYLAKQWDKLNVYTRDGRLRIDNNLTENAIRPFVIGRKNWMFSTSVDGANTSANLYSLVETAKANGLEPYAYLKMVLTELPAANSLEDIERLLPFGQADSKRISARLQLTAYYQHQALVSALQMNGVTSVVLLFCQRRRYQVLDETPGLAVERI